MLLVIKAGWRRVGELWVILLKMIKMVKKNYSITGFFIISLSADKISHLSLEERGLAHMVSAHRLTDENISVVLELSNL